MFRKSLGAISASVLLAGGLAFSKDAAFAAGETTYGAGAYDWLSPAPLLWTPPSTFNWADSPVKLNAHEYFGHNDNILNAYSTMSLPSNIRRGDFYTQTALGASSQFNAGAQQFFVDGEYTIMNYLHDASLDAHNYNIDGGVNWNVTSRCKGKLIGIDKELQTEFDELFAPGVDFIHTTSLNETGECNFYDAFGFIFNSGLLSQGHSLTLDQIQNYDLSYVEGGIQYAFTGLDTLQFSVKYDVRNFTNRSAAMLSSAGITTLGLQQYNRQVDYQIKYNRTFSQKLDVELMAGWVENPDVAGYGAISSRAETSPIYSATMNGRVAEMARGAGRESHRRRARVGDRQCASLRWPNGFSDIFLDFRNSSLQGAFGRTVLEGSPSSGDYPIYYGPSTLLNYSMKAAYQVTPFTSASASFQRWRRAVSGTNITSDVLMMGLDYQPR